MTFAAMMDKLMNPPASQFECSHSVCYLMIYFPNTPNEFAAWVCKGCKSIRDIFEAGE